MTCMHPPPHMTWKLGVAWADAQRAVLEAKVQQLSDRVAELKEDKESLQSTLSEVMGRAGDASLQSEAHWKDRLEAADANSRRKLEQMRKANEEALAAVTRTFESEREALCLRVSSLEQQASSSTTTTPSFPTHHHPYLKSTLPPPGGCCRGRPASLSKTLLLLPSSSSFFSSSRWLMQHQRQNCGVQSRRQCPMTMKQVHVANVLLIYC